MVNPASCIPHVLSVNLDVIVPPSPPNGRLLRCLWVDGDLVLMGTDDGTHRAWISDAESFDTSKNPTPLVRTPVNVDRISLSHGGVRLAVTGRPESGEPSSTETRFFISDTATKNSSK